jgi:hypothetical protein
MFKQPWIALTAATALAPGAVGALLLLSGRGDGRVGRPLAALVGVTQFGVVALNAVSRQVVQHVEIGATYNILEQPARVQWAPLMIFLVIAVSALIVVGWLIYQVAKLPAKTDAA